ncbi:DUF2207 domain-containing protein [Granulicoccus sp. GXG6511]|uniref:DUF2207 domain-containing protein n=1 Tax=Granulicoccus sp. GXG6511 TaxID=3381351 RepID=UPI003D7D5B66
MRHSARLLLVLLMVVASLSFAPRAYADDQPSSWNIPRYDVTAQLQPDGLARVTLDFDFDFARDPGHGPFIVLPLRQEVLDNPDVWRMMDVDVESVTSGTGANTNLAYQQENGNLLVRVGRQGTRFTGVQNYRITYSIRGLIAPNHAQSGLDEFNWNAVGLGWQVPIRAASVRVEGPANIDRVACWTGSGFTTECQSASDGSAGTFAASNLGPNRGMQVVAGFPAGTFTGAEPRYEKRPHIGNMFPVTPLTGGLTAVLSLLGVGTVIHQARRRGRDEAYVGLTPGLTPMAGEEAQVGTARKRPVTVQFSPPKNATAGELGTLIDASADNRDITGAIIGLAVRGHIHIDQVSNKNWQFTLRQSNDQLLPFERDLMRRLFRGRQRVTTNDMRDKAYAGLLPNTRAALYRQVAQERGWFRRRPDLAKATAMGLGVLIAGAGVGVGFLLGVTAGWGLVGVAGIITGLVLMAVSGSMPARTAEGSAMLAQTKGFELYLRTAEADQIRFEEGVDVFSRYLPYAIVFGVAERWTKVFEQLAREGRYEPNMYWYGSPHSTGFFYGAAFGSMMDSMTSAMSSAMAAAVSSAATAATGGGSGFSGGGGFGGGGGGGW